MSRLWDTSEFYARSEADELLRDFPNTSVAELADSFVQSRPVYEQDPQFSREIGVELLKRVAAGVRFWPEHLGLPLIEDEVRAIIGRAASALCVAAPAQEEANVPDYWWQRM